MYDRAAGLEPWVWGDSGEGTWWGTPSGGGRGLRHWAMKSLRRLQTLRHIFYLCWLSWVSSYCLTAFLFREKKKVKNSHKLDCLKEADFSVFSPAAGPWDKEVFFERKWIGPGCRGLGDGRWVVKCRVRLFYQVLPCQQGDVSLSPWAVVTQETNPTAGSWLGGLSRSFTSLVYV